MSSEKLIQNKVVGVVVMMADWIERTSIEQVVSCMVMQFSLRMCRISLLTSKETTYSNL